MVVEGGIWAYFPFRRYCGRVLISSQVECAKKKNQSLQKQMILIRSRVSQYKTQYIEGTIKEVSIHTNDQKILT
jgi:hypothetical protein